MSVVTLFHGTSAESAEALLRDGWQPLSSPAGNQMGRRNLLYLTTTAENAAWYAEQKGSDTVLEVTLELDDLVVDPEDGTADTVDGELNLRHGLPGNLATCRTLPAAAFHPLSRALKL